MLHEKVLADGGERVESFCGEQPGIPAEVQAAAYSLERVRPLQRLQPVVGVHVHGARHREEAVEASQVQQCLVALEPEVAAHDLERPEAVQRAQTHELVLLEDGAAQCVHDRRRGDLGLR